LGDSISLRTCAGEAHGVRVGGIYRIDRSNLRGASDVSKLGSLKVLRLNDDDIIVTLDDSCVDFQIISFFYAVEEDCYFDPIKNLSREALKPRTSIPIAAGLRQQKKKKSC